MSLCCQSSRKRKLRSNSYSNMCLKTIRT